MSVYTVIPDNAFSQLISNYSLGTFSKANGINAGIENSNYFVVTSGGEFVFTLFEIIDTKTLEHYVSLLVQLNQAGIPCPNPKPDNYNNFIQHYQGKPAIIVDRIPGKNIETATYKQVETLALNLAKFHCVQFDLPARIEHRRGTKWRQKTASAVLPYLDKPQQSLIKSELDLYKSVNLDGLPSGVIHSDLFKDNVLFESNELTGILDFYDACHDVLLYDIAVTINAWCFSLDGKFNYELFSTFLQSYQEIRKLNEAERQTLPLMFRIAAMRFWLSRLYDSLNTKEGELTHLKDPDEFERILLYHANNKILPREI